MKKEKISVIVPCYNEEESLPIFYKEITKVIKEMGNVEFELLFINDGSKDNTLNILRSLSKKDKRVRYISLSRNFGKEGGMYAGLENATGDLVAIMDADMQDPPSMIKEMYRSIKEEGYDCVALYSPKHKDYGFIRKVFTKCWYKLIGAISSTPQVPGAREFRLMKRKVVDAILEVSEYHRFSKGIFSFVGFNTYYLPYEVEERKNGTSKWSFWKLFNYAIEGIVAFTTTPLRIPFIFSFITLLVAIIYFIVTLFAGSNAFSVLLIIILFLFGILFALIGVFGEYLSRTYMQVKQRPVYIVKEKKESFKK